MLVENSDTEFFEIMLQLPKPVLEACLLPEVSAPIHLCDPKPVLEACLLPEVSASIHLCGST